MTVGRRLRIARERMGISQIGVFKKIGINNKTLSGYEKDVASPDYETLLKLARLYEVSVTWVISGQNEPDGPIELRELLTQTDIQIRGLKLSDEDKQKIYDVVTGLYWEKIMAKEGN